MPIINKTVFSSVKVIAPRLSEQLCIADGLAAIDARIATESLKLNALTSHKKGLLQQLFPTMGEDL